MCVCSPKCPLALNHSWMECMEEAAVPDDQHDLMGSPQTIGTSPLLPSPLPPYTSTVKPPIYVWEGHREVFFIGRSRIIKVVLYSEVVCLYECPLLEVPIRKYSGIDMLGKGLRKATERCRSG